MFWCIYWNWRKDKIFFKKFISWHEVIYKSRIPLRTWTSFAEGLQNIKELSANNKWEIAWHVMLVFRSKRKIYIYRERVDMGPPCPNPSCGLNNSSCLFSYILNETIRILSVIIIQLGKKARWLELTIEPSTFLSRLARILTITL